MNDATSQVERRLREALTEAGATIDTSMLRPLQAPERHRRFHSKPRLVTATAAAAVVALATAIILSDGRLGGAKDIVASSPELAQSDKADLLLFFCSSTAQPQEPKCQGRDATQDDFRRIEEAVWQTPGVVDVLFVSQALALDNFRSDFARNTALLRKIKVADMQPILRVKLAEGFDPMQVIQHLQATPGVAGLHPPAAKQTPAYKQESSQVRVSVCAQGSPLPACGGTMPSADGPVSTDDEGKHGKKITQAQKNVLRKMINSMPEVESFVFETQQAAYEKFRIAYAKNKKLLEATKVSDMPESFLVTLKVGASGEEVGNRLRQQPGVAQVVNQSCMFEQLKLLIDYRLSIPDGQACAHL
ncbi:permease-like cell division protein FtsX [Nonomuraea sp. NPDC050202]|uniref:permease-like cell division protein FtsX n=1 Tax=Nonomuraea sp. NPDC050202 TaxID=3155035 RepID=UPI00340F1ABA